MLAVVLKLPAIAGLLIFIYSCTISPSMLDLSLVKSSMLTYKPSISMRHSLFKCAFIIVFIGVIVAPITMWYFILN